MVMLFSGLINLNFLFFTLSLKISINAFDFKFLDSVTTNMTMKNLSDISNEANTMIPKWSLPTTTRDTTALQSSTIPSGISQVLYIMIDNRDYDI